jgi:signal transduction histidine kinase
MTWSWLRRRPYLIDAAIVLVLGVGYVGRAAHFGRYAVDLPLAVLYVVPLLARRRYPYAVLAFVSAVWVADAIAYSPVPPFATAFALYTVVVALDRMRGLAAAALATALPVVVTLARGEYNLAVLSLVLLGAAWVGGDNHRTRVAYVEALEERAQRLEREQEAERARAVAEEQARIGRELHDVIAHNVSVMVVQAAAANDVFDTRPEDAREALRAIESTGRGALAELRRLLGSVRGDGAQYAPQPGLDRLDDLLDQVRTAGLAVSVTIEGRPRELPAGIDLSAYRIVQEALTNTLKHAGATRADVALRYADDELGVEIRDDGTGAGNGGGGGRGLVGMRERVALSGGSLAAGPAPGGGYAVDARFPLGSHR